MQECSGGPERSVPTRLEGRFITQSILVVEDDAAQASLLEVYLRKIGLEVWGVSTLSAAVEALQLREPDLVLTDIHLPDGSGLDLLDAVRRLRMGADVLVITGMDDISLAAQAMKQGAFDFLPKPLDLPTLDAAVRRCIQDRQARGAAMGSRPAEVKDDPPLVRVVGRSPRMVEVFKLVGMAAANRSPVLIRGETGTGKEVVARAIHRFSSPAEPYVAVNCAALTDTLLESDLFGHTRGAFTGAQGARRGKFELAGKGTLFLDEIGDTSPSFQTGILRAVQEGEVIPLGGERPVKVHARLVTATHRPLEALVDEGTFRADLYYRLRVIEITIPALRERREDLPDLVDYFFHRAAGMVNRRVLGLDPAVERWVQGQDWPGNVRELENTITRGVAMARGAVLTVRDLAAASGETNGNGDSPHHDEPADSADLTLDQVVLKHVERTLAAVGGNKREACRRLGISPARLYRLLDQSEGEGEDDSQLS